MRRLAILGLGLVLGVAGCGASSGQALTILHEVGPLGGSGTFTIIGDAVDGNIVCDAGTVEAVSVGVESELATFQDEMTCVDGSGSFVVGVEQPRDDWQYPDPYTGGSWRILSGTGDYEGLSGSGTYEAVYEPNWVQTYDGTIAR